MSTEAGGAQHVNFIQADCNNYIMRRRTEFLKSGDSTCLIEYIKKKQIKDKSFFYAFPTNMENEICGCFFCDGNLRQYYAIFGDAICFDTTFKINNYNMVCAPIVGINNHGHTILFECDFLDGEITEACAWLFNMFLQAMKDKKPTTIHFLWSFGIDFMFGISVKNMMVWQLWCSKTATLLLMERC